MKIIPTAIMITALSAPAHASDWGAVGQALMGIANIPNQIQPRPIYQPYNYGTGTTYIQGSGFNGTHQQLGGGIGAINGQANGRNVNCSTVQIGPDMVSVNCQ